MTTTDGSALLRAILADPHEDTVRLAYADYLDENGEAERAKFIRVQCELSKYSCNFKQTKEQPGWFHDCGTYEDGYWKCQPLRSRERELLNDHWMGWSPGGFLGVDSDNFVLSESEDDGLGDDPPTCKFHRGFVSEIHLPLAAFTEEMAKAIFGQHPVTRVVLTDREPGNYRGGRGDPGGWWWEPGFQQNALRQINFEIGDAGVKARVWRVGFHGGLMVYVPLDSNPRDRGWNTCEDALDALSTACVNYGRSLVGLEPLPTDNRTTDATV